MDTRLDPSGKVKAVRAVQSLQSRIEQQDLKAMWRQLKEPEPDDTFSSAQHQWYSCVGMVFGSAKDIRGIDMSKRIALDHVPVY